MVGAIAVATVGFLLLWLAPWPGLNLTGLMITGVGAANFLSPIVIGRHQHDAAAQPRHRSPFDRGGAGHFGGPAAAGVAR